MSECCINCFSDPIIQELSIVKKHSKNGRCSFCGSENILCFSPDILFDTLEITTNCLISDVNGDFPHIIYEREFCILSKIVKNPESLWEAILGEDFVRDKYILIFDTSEYSLEWGAFKRELMHENRFFPNNSIYSQIFSDKSIFAVLEELETTRSNVDDFYRARISDAPLDRIKMGVPPAHLVTAGRANPVGISYLYLAEDIDTAILEVRPSNGAIVYVSKFNPNSNLKLLDLTDPKLTASVLRQGEEIESALKYLNLLELFARELAKPVLPDKSHLDYIPTQFICEFFKSKANVDGIVFSSSFGRGRNIVLFSSDKVENENPIHFKITKTTHEYDQL